MLVKSNIGLKPLKHEEITFILVLIPYFIGAISSKNVVKSGGVWTKR